MLAAFLILAHHQPEHLARLIERLSVPWGRVYVHLDARVELAPFLRRIGDRPGVRWIPQQRRIAVHWGGFSQVQASLALVECARRECPDYRRFVLLSGADYPVAPLGEIARALESPREFIGIARRCDDQARSDHGWRVRYVHFPESRWRRLGGLLPRLRPPPIPLYQGSQWWALSAPCMDYLLAWLARNPQYARFLRHAYCSDEVFFHSIVKQSPFAAQTAQDLDRAAAPGSHPLGPVFGCHYIDWHTPGERLPKILDAGDFERLRRSGALFARKFDSARSAALLDRLDRELFT